jgi:aminopeptidase N
MKRPSLLFAQILLLASFATAQRLPNNAVPENYKLSFAPDFTKDNFGGEETIQIQVLKPTSQIVLNSVDIVFQDASITSGGVTQKAKIKLDKEKEMATLAVDKPLAAGAATIHIKYIGILNNELRGFYLGKDGQGRKYAVTQLESTDARRAFPSFDEPAYKAAFDITVIADKGHVAISNNKVESDTPGPREGKHTVKFATTAKMSSYLMAVAVGDFEYIEGSADGIPIRVYSTPGKKQLGAFALQAAENVLRYFDRYLGVKYPFGKLDLIGLPDFSAGAMENTGCITFRESVLLLDEQHASVRMKREVASVIAHEIAHQWFGDLVTMKWWDDVWLNEGFATWMETKSVEPWKPEWNLELDDALETVRALNEDSLASTRPIHQAAETPAQILELFDGIAYGKAAAVLRMLEAYAGPETFRAGVSQYLKRHAYGSATADDFWSALAQVSKKPVDQIMPTFVKQPGAPLVSVKSRCAGNATTTVTLRQQRYFYDRAMFNAGSDELWQVPVCMKTASAQAGKTAETCELLNKKEEIFTLPGCAPWVLANAGATGYYRTGYLQEAVSALAHDVETALTPAERITLLADTWAGVGVGRQPMGDYLELAEGLQADRNRAVLEQLFNQLDYIGEHLVNDNDRDVYQIWLRGLLTPLAQELGWEQKPGESDERKSLRAQLLQTLGHTGGDSQALTEARKLTEQALKNPASVEGDLASAALALAAQNGDSALYEKVLARTKSPKTPEEYYLYFRTLGRFSDPKLLQRTLEYAISPAVRSQDTLGLIARVMRNRAGQKVAWDFVRSHWDDVERAGGPFASAEIVEVAGSFCDAGMRNEIKDFFAAHRVPAAERTLKQSLEQVNYCIDLRTQQEGQLASWLERHGASTGQ